MIREKNKPTAKLYMKNSTENLGRDEAFDQHEQYPSPHSVHTCQICPLSATHYMGPSADAHGT